MNCFYALLLLPSDIHFFENPNCKNNGLGRGELGIWRLTGFYGKATAMNLEKVKLPLTFPLHLSSGLVFKLCRLTWVAMDRLLIGLNINLL